MDGSQSLGFESWIVLIFDHFQSIESPSNYDIPWDYEAEPELVLSYLTRLFENAGALLTPYTDPQVSNGLEYLVSPNFSNYMFVLQDTNIAMEKRIRCIEAFYYLFSTFFAVRCENEIRGTLLEKIRSLCWKCYTWYDLIPIHANWVSDASQPEFNDAMLAVMQKTLSVSHPLCQKGGLHGLGLWHYTYPERVERIIDQFIAEFPNISDDVRNYAQQARRGYVRDWH
ncbi:MAG: hypothetical protein LCI00_13300 [Chloroflexi bacterium]|nr:hypothetical protein [Chloroflexota bacterium]MCC6893456.1 hypothetical protein [Anaerolineae bacterium]